MKKKPQNTIIEMFSQCGPETYSSYWNIWIAWIISSSDNMPEYREGQEHTILSRYSAEHLMIFLEVFLNLTRFCPLSIT